MAAIIEQIWEKKDGDDENEKIKMRMEMVHKKTEADNNFVLNKSHLQPGF